MLSFFCHIFISLKNIVIICYFTTKAWIKTQTLFRRDLHISKHQNGKEDEVICFWKSFDYEMKVAKEMNSESLPFSLLPPPLQGAFRQYLLYLFFCETEVAVWLSHSPLFKSLHLSLCLVSSCLPPWRQQLRLGLPDFLSLMSAFYRIFPGFGKKHSNSYLYSRKLK